MKLPNINIAFSTQAATAIARSEKGVLALIVRDIKATGVYTLTSITQIPDDLGISNRGYIERAFIGYINPPKKILLCVLDDEADIVDALNFFATQKFDYLVGPPNISTEEGIKIIAWIKEQRNAGYIPKAVLPNTTADSEAIINFTTSGINDGTTEFTTAEYCSRIAGLIAGTPMTIACTNAVLPEVIDIDRLTKEAMDTANENGEFIIHHDGEKTKVGRGVNSLHTTTKEKGEAFKKIKIIEAVDMIGKDIKRTAEDSYIGKYANSYDNKCLLISAIKGYFLGLENDGILERNTSVIEIDIEAQEAYLQSVGKDITTMSEQEIKEATTADKVFLKANISILDAIEDINLNIII